MVEIIEAQPTPGSTVVSDNLALPPDTSIIGHVEPLLGRVALKSVDGYFGFPLIKEGQPVTQAIINKAENVGRLFELIASTEEN
jgi:hypothetical protein